MIGSVQEMIEEMKNGTYDLTNNGCCTGCGNCCSNILPMTEKEVQVIHDYIKVHKIEAQDHFLNVLSAEIIADMTCPFCDLTKENEKCTIYPVRPWICKQFKCDLSSKGVIFSPRGKYSVVDVYDEFYGTK